MKLTPLSKILIVLLGTGGAYVAARRAGLLDKLMPEAQTQAPVVPPKVDLPALPGGENAAQTPVTMPGSEPGCVDQTDVRFLIWAWNAQMGGLFANGGPRAAKDSLMCKHG